MRKVKCRITGEYGYDYEFYKATNGKYYKNKEIYEKAIIQRNYIKKIINFINLDILKKKNINCASLIGKLISETGLEAKVIYDSIVEKYECIKKLIDESTESDPSKIYLIFAIATKSLNKTTYAGCYEIRNKKTNMVYIGESINLFGRFTTHISELYEGKHHCKKLQDDFNETNSISNFIISPLFMFPISSIDKNKIKQETLYLESAFYLIYKSNKEELYNTINPYIALKNNSVSLKEYQIDCNKVLQLLANDKYRVIPNKLLKSIKDDLNKEKQFVGVFDSITENNSNIISDHNTKIECFGEINIDDIGSCIEYTNKLLQNNVKLYRFRDLLTDFVKNGILPNNYKYSKIRNILVENNLIIIDSANHTIATDYALKNQLYFISRCHTKNDITTYNYYLSEKCKKLLIDIFSNYKNMDQLSRAS